MARRIERLIFVFDANAGKLGALVDSVKKLLTINGCPLCAITHGLAGERAEWKECKEGFGVPVDYLHRNELSDSMRQLVGSAMPCIIAAVSGERVMLIGPDVLARCKGGVPDLRGRLLAHAASAGLELPFMGHSRPRATSDDGMAAER